MSYSLTFFSNYSVNVKSDGAYLSSPSPISAPSKLNCQITSKTWYNSCRPTPPLMWPSTLFPRVLVPLHKVEDESPLLPTPAAVLKVSISGFIVSGLPSQKRSLAFFVRNKCEYAITAMSCSPLSVALANVERYLNSCGNALLLADVPFGFFLWEAARRMVRTVDVRSGIASSGLVACASSGRNGANGSSCWTRASTRAGIPV